MKTITMIRNSRPGDIGGAEKYPIIIGKILAQRNYKVIVMSSNAKTISMAEEAGVTGKKSPWLSFQNFSSYRILLFPLYLLWQSYLVLWYVIRFVGLGVDIIYPQSRDDFIASSLAGIILRKKVIWTDHADLKHVYLNNKTFYKNPVGKLVYFISKFVHRVTIESLSEKKLIEQSLGKECPSNYEVMYIGVLDSYKSSSRENKKVTFVSTSRLVKDKGIAELIEAFKMIENHNVLLKICGDGPDANIFKNMAKGDDRIEFKGFVDDVNGILRRCDVLIHPTYHEGFGLSLVEAEMNGLPIIASNVGSIPEIVRHTVSGMLVPAKDVDSLYRSMIELIEDRALREKMGDAGRKIFLDKFQIDRIVDEKLIPLIEE